MDVFTIFVTALLVLFAYILIGFLVYMAFESTVGEERALVYSVLWVPYFIVWSMFMLVKSFNFLVNDIISGYFLK